jgi:hypothetical protein
VEERGRRREGEDWRSKRGGEKRMSDKDDHPDTQDAVGTPPLSAQQGSQYYIQSSSINGPR